MPENVMTPETSASTREGRTMCKRILVVEPSPNQRIETQDTQPLPIINAFQVYLDRYHLTWIQVARVAEVPSLTVWSMAHGMLVSPRHAMRVKAALGQLTGVPFTRPIPTMPLRTID